MLPWQTLQGRRERIAPPQPSQMQKVENCLGKGDGMKPTAYSWSLDCPSQRRHGPTTVVPQAVLPNSYWNCIMQLAAHILPSPIFPGLDRKQKTRLLWLGGFHKAVVDWEPELLWWDQASNIKKRSFIYRIAHRHSRPDVV